VMGCWGGPGTGHGVGVRGGGMGVGWSVDRGEGVGDQGWVCNCILVWRGGWVSMNRRQEMGGRGEG